MIFLSARIQRPLALAVLLTCALFGPAAADDSGEPSDPCASLRKEIAKLQETIAELQDTNSLFIENLANCAEENQSLLERLEPPQIPETVESKARKEQLIHLLQQRLDSQEPPAYLRKLELDELEALVTTIEKRLSTVSKAP